MKPFFFILLFFSCLLDAYDQKILGEKIFAVHATSIYPREGVLQAGLGDKLKGVPGYKKVPVDLYPDFRCTLHFALGEMVRPVEGAGSWEGCAFAVVTPLSEILPQTINLNCYDTFILGNYELQESATLVVPLEERSRVPEKRSYQVYFYDSGTSLREAVDQVIEQKEGFHIRMLTTDREDELVEAYLEEANVNTVEFFAPLREERPYLSVGCRFDPLEPVNGEAYRFGSLETAFYLVALSYLKEEEAEGLTLPLLKEIRENLVYERDLVRTMVSSYPFSTRVLDDFTRKDQHLQSWINIIDVDIQLRQFFGKTVMTAPEEKWEAICLYRWKTEELFTFLQGELEWLPDQM